MKKKLGRKLRLDKETVKRLELLDSPEIQGIAGGCEPSGCGCEPVTMCDCTSVSLCAGEFCA